MTLFPDCTPHLEAVFSTVSVKFFSSSPVEQNKMANSVIVWNDNRLSDPYARENCLVSTAFIQIKYIFFLVCVYMCLSTVSVHTEHHYQYCLFASLLQFTSYLENNHKGQSNSQHSPEFFGDLIRSSWPRRFSVVLVSSETGKYMLGLSSLLEKSQSSQIWGFTSIS